MFQKRETYTISEFLQLNNPSKTHPLKEKTDFFLQTYLKEVATAKQKKKRKYLNLIVKTLSASLSVLVFATPAFAQTPIPTTIPLEIESLLQTIQIICLSLVAGVATISLMLAGALKIVGLGEKAKSWSIEILKGTIQVVSAPAIVYLLITLAKGLLSPLPGFQNF